jgi:hypothetical protein
MRLCDNFLGQFCGVCRIRLSAQSQAACAGRRFPACYHQQLGCTHTHTHTMEIHHWQSKTASNLNWFISEHESRFILPKLSKFSRSGKFCQTRTKKQDGRKEAPCNAPWQYSCYCFHASWTGQDNPTPSAGVSNLLSSEGGGEKMYSFEITCSENWVKKYRSEYCMIASSITSSLQKVNDRTGINTGLKLARLNSWSS